jgi:hypothetical protein
LMLNDALLDVNSTARRFVDNTSQFRKQFGHSVKLIRND